MRMMIKKLLKKYKYPPEGMEDALETVMTQCELWTDNNDMEVPEPEGQESAVTKFAETKPVKHEKKVYTYDNYRPKVLKVAEKPAPYGHMHPGAKK